MICIPPPEKTIVCQHLLPDKVLVEYSDGSTAEIVYSYNPAMDGVDGCDGFYVDLFPNG